MDDAEILIPDRENLVAQAKKNAEQIVVIDEGKIVDKGTHDELMNRCETYKEIVISQIELEENNQ